MAKNIVIFSDGTAMAGGRRPDQLLSNVYKLYNASRPGVESIIDPAEQLCFYEAGLGTKEISGTPWFRPLSYARKFLSLGLGTGLMSNVSDCYKLILKYYEPGDRIFLFGFSRGAYTVRTLCSVMNLCGVPTHDLDNSDLPRGGKALSRIADEAVFKVYGHGAGKSREKYETEREELASRFRQKYGAQDDLIENKRGNVVPYCVGVFDTVASLGASGVRRAAILGLSGVVLAFFSFIAVHALNWLLPIDLSDSFLLFFFCIVLVSTAINFKSQYRSIRDFPERGDHKWHLAAWRFRDYDMFLDPRVRYARHAIALDEERCSFSRVGWAREADVQNAPEDWLVQKWFPGNHSDIGGGTYPEPESRLSDISLQWMLDEVTALPDGLKIDKSKINLFPDPTGVQHCEVRAVRDMYPPWVPMKFRITWRRELRSGVTREACHESVFRRMYEEYVYRNGDKIKYRPAQLHD
ncbi:DUF2235 domain-containing protein [Halomonas sp.]|uniref:DUF2235 domain-containing protein n=1 Tax=Halomonas sp. TaxID=1486246 RepID=UPI00298E2953|nr:DUF2235 domain-containing protein [Halomonas sp.]MDW7662472.1 DUF2235 domain-containing protein [Bacillota bacterium]MDW7748424.1 DUF2235 domain-containing protein [Halomonas sp.]